MIRQGEAVLLLFGEKRPDELGLLPPSLAWMIIMAFAITFDTRMYIWERIRYGFAREHYSAAFRRSGASGEENFCILRLFKSL